MTTDYEAFEDLFKNLFHDLITDKFMLYTTWKTQALNLNAAAASIFWELLTSNEKIKFDLDSNVQTENQLLLQTAGLNCAWAIIAGYSIECLIKAIILLTTQKEPIKEDKKFDPPWNGNPHDLLRLIMKVNQHYKSQIPTFTDSEKSLMQKLSEYTTWRGKYPFPITWTSIRPFKENYDGKGNVLHFSLGPIRLKEDIRIYKKVFDSLKLSLETIYEKMKSNV